jgi:hypothetical protein
MFWANTVGLPRIVAKLEALQGSPRRHLQAAPLLVKLAREGRSF